jgi:hypothetical protein
LWFDWNPGAHSLAILWRIINQFAEDAWRSRIRASLLPLPVGFGREHVDVHEHCNPDHQSHRREDCAHGLALHSHSYWDHDAYGGQNQSDDLQPLPTAPLGNALVLAEHFLQLGESAVFDGLPALLRAIEGLALASALGLLLCVLAGAQAPEDMQLPTATLLATLSRWANGAAEVSRAWAPAILAVGTLAGSLLIAGLLRSLLNPSARLRNTA